MGKLIGLSEDIRLRRLEPSSHLIEAIQTSPSTPVKTMLRLDGETVWKIGRLRCANGKPEFVVSTYRGDSYRVQVLLKR